MVKSGENKKLTGEYETKIVAGYRIAIPSELRSNLSSSCVITKGYEHCLILIPRESWNTLVEPLEKSSFFDRNIRDTLRFLVGSSHEVKPDKQGRIVVPQMLREYSGIGSQEDDKNKMSEAVFVGLINWVEIWEKERWFQRVSYIENNADSIAQELQYISKQE